ncbi:hypothetical protein KGP36_02570 [Patescibacteria group bacterium]|nr:hypothetical protein [Patescibacteria group bacterium]
MALPNQKTFLQMQQEISEIVKRITYPNTLQDGQDSPGLTRLQQIINDAYSQIATEKDWRWRFYDGYNFNTVVGQQTPYTMPDDCAEILDMTIPAYQQRLWATEYYQWITNYPGQYTNYGPTKPWTYIPAAYSGNNNLQVYLFPAADAPSNGTGAYSVHVPYLKRPLVLVNPTDIPNCPPEFQDLVISRAICNAFRYLGDPQYKMWDDAFGAPTLPSRRYSEMWVRNQKFAEALANLRNNRNEWAFTSALDINRVLFSYGG